MGRISNWFNKEATQEYKAEAITGWTKVNHRIRTGVACFWYRNIDDKAYYRVEAKILKDTGVDKTLDITTGRVIEKRYEDYQHFFFNFDNAEEAQEKLLKQLENSAYYGRGSGNRVYLD